MQEARPVEKDETLRFIADVLNENQGRGNEYITLDGAVMEYGAVTVDVITRSGDLARVIVQAKRS